MGGLAIVRVDLIGKSWMEVLRRSVRERRMQTDDEGDIDAQRDLDLLEGVEDQDAQLFVEVGKIDGRLQSCAWPKRIEYAQ